MTSLPERTPKKTTFPSILTLLSNGCKQAFPLLTVGLQRALHNITQSRAKACRNAGIFFCN
jgi:hypothetical protein